MNKPKNMADIFEMIPEELKVNLTPAENILLTTAATVDFSGGSADIDAPQNGHEWGLERTIRADLLYWICTHNLERLIDRRYGVTTKGARIIGKLDFTWSKLLYPLSLNYCYIEDTVLLMDADSAQINFTGSYMHSLHADRLTVKGSLRLDNVMVKNGVRLVNARIGAQLSCVDAVIEHPDEEALLADGMTTKSAVWLRGIKTRGEVSFSRASIGGQLVCDKAVFSNPNGDAFKGWGLAVNGDVMLRDATLIGGADFTGAKIESQFACNGSSFINPNGIAFNADGLIVEGGLFFKKSSMKQNQNTEVQGSLHLIGANVVRLECCGLQFGTSQSHGFIAENLVVKSVLNFLGAKFSGGVNLAHAQVGQLVDDESSWPQDDFLIINGFEYKALAGDNAPTLKQRLRWIDLQPKHAYRFQPYEYLASIYRQMGHESDARTVLFEKREAIRKYGALSPGAKAVNCFLGLTIGHGYRPGFLILYILLFVLLGFGIFEWAFNQGIMQPSKEGVYLHELVANEGLLPTRYPQFNAFIYSIESFIPFLDLHQKNYWLPDSTKPFDKVFMGLPCGYWIRWYFWLHIVFGWVCSTLIAVYVANLMRRE